MGALCEKAGEPVIRGHHLGTMNDCTECVNHRVDVKIFNLIGEHFSPAGAYANQGITKVILWGPLTPAQTLTAIHATIVEIFHFKRKYIVLLSSPHQR